MILGGRVDAGVLCGGVDGATAGEVVVTFGFVEVGRGSSGAGGNDAAGCVVGGTDFGGMDPGASIAAADPPVPFGSYFCVLETFPCASIVHAFSLFGSLTNTRPPLSTTSKSPASPVTEIVSIRFADATSTTIKVPWV